MNKKALFAAVIWMVVELVLIAISLYQAEGRLVYTIDDPYIHLSVAESIIDGNYGINSSENSSPSSSLIYPFILAVLLRLGAGSLSALFINVMVMAYAVYCAANFLIEELDSANSDPCHGYICGLEWVIPLLVFCIISNSFALPMTGMEHSFHVLLTLLVVVGLVGLGRQSDVQTAPFILAVAALPFVRFEGFSLWFFSIFALVYYSRYRAAFSAMVLVLIGFGVWVMYSESKSISMIPSSILSKSEMAAGIHDGEGWRSAILLTYNNFIENLKDRQGKVLLGILLAVGFLGYIDNCRHRRVPGLLVFMALFTGVAHLLFGRFGWFCRYEPYIFAEVIIVLLMLLAPRFSDLRTASLILSIALVLGWPYLDNTLKVPSASLNIYQQQYQMHRFVTDYWRGAVAVNDIGLVSYDNPYLVVDLWGLGSETIRQLHRAGKLTPEVMDRYLSDRGVTLVMIYDAWFRQHGLLPDAWRKVADLHTSKVSTPFDRVAIYATRNQGYSEIMSLLHAFNATLPKGAEMLFN